MIKQEKEDNLLTNDNGYREKRKVMECTRGNGMYDGELVFDNDRMKKNRISLVCTCINCTNEISKRKKIIVVPNYNVHFFFTFYDKLFLGWYI